MEVSFDSQDVTCCDYSRILYKEYFIPESDTLRFGFRWLDTDGSLSYRAIYDFNAGSVQELLDAIREESVSNDDRFGLEPSDMLSIYFSRRYDECKPTASDINPEPNPLAEGFLEAVRSALCIVSTRFRDWQRQALGKAIETVLESCENSLHIEVTKYRQIEGFSFRILMSSSSESAQMWEEYRSARSDSPVTPLVAFETRWPLP